MSHKVDVTKMSRSEFLVYRIESTNAWWARYGVKLEAKTDDEGFVRLRMLKTESPYAQEWQKTCPVNDESLFPSLLRLLDNYERVREFQQLQARAEKVLRLKEMQFNPLIINSDGFVSLVFERANESPLMSFLFGGLPTMSEPCVGTEECSVRLYLTDTSLKAFRSLIDREEARRLLASKLKYLVSDCGATVQMWDERVVVNIACDAIRRSLEYEMTMKDVKELLQEIDRIRESKSE